MPETIEETYKDKPITDELIKNVNAIKKIMDLPTNEENVHAFAEASVEMIKDCVEIFSFVKEHGEAMIYLLGGKE